MRWTIEFASSRVEGELRKMQPAFVARFLRYAERMELYGPDLGMPHTRAMGEGLYELRLNAKTPVKELAIARQRLRSLRQ